MKSRKNRPIKTDLGRGFEDIQIHDGSVSSVEVLDSEKTDPEFLSLV